MERLSFSRGLWLFIWRAAAVLVDLSLAALGAGYFLRLSERLSARVLVYFASEAAVGDGVTEDLVIGCSVAFAMAVSVGAFAWLFSSALFRASCVRVFGASPGKYLLGLRVRRSSGERVKFFRALGREGAKLWSALFLGVGYLAAIWTARGQALHDKLSRCVVEPAGRRSPFFAALSLTAAAVLLSIEVPTLYRRVDAVVEPFRQAVHAARHPGPIEQLSWALVKRGWADFERSMAADHAPSH